MMERTTTTGIQPQATLQGLTFFPIPDFNGAKSAFGAESRDFFARDNLPDVPEKFADMANDLFFNGGKLPQLSPKIDKQKAVSALRAWLGSFAPAHEAKITTVAYALWLWTNDAAIDEFASQIKKAKKTKRGSARAARRHGMTKKETP